MNDVPNRNLHRRINRRLNESPYSIERRRTRSPQRRNAISFNLLEESKGLIKEGLNLNSEVIYSEGLDFCVICQDEIFLDITRKLSCKHVYHLKCIDNWFVHSDICPTCKRKF